MWDGYGRFSHKNSLEKISSWAKVMGIAKYFCRPSQYWISPNMPTSWAMFPQNAPFIMQEDGKFAADMYKIEVDM